MRLRLRGSLLTIVCAGAVGAFSVGVSAETLKVTTSPSGALVEIDGSRVCNTPCELKYPGDYFHKPHTVFSSRLEHSMVMKLSKPGFRTKEMTLTDGPIAWTDLRGRRHGEYYILKSEAVDVTLDPLPPTESDDGSEIEPAGPIRPARGHSGVAALGETQMGNGTVKVQSGTMCADIYVDGNFVGQTPAEFLLAAGLHHLMIKAQGREAWERDVEVMKDSQVTLNPVLDSVGSAATR
ncbi:MAG TPA: PEGA domain-containing protein [Candidatus Acidoferrum sp.]|nr:PEGA domain-containing protein [Candidatus Acidoferrum sp.]